MMRGAFRFIHCADLHLGARFKGLDIKDRNLAERLRDSVMESFERIVDRAIGEKVEALVISGDLYDDGNELPSTRLWFSEQLSRLDIPVFICRGNHDSSTSWDDCINYPPNVHEFGTEPERIGITEDVEILGCSYSTQHETRNLAKLMDGDPSKFTIACIHCDIDTVSEGYPYAPCSLSDTVGRSVDYWALGHIHKRNMVSTSPHVVYPGNIQGRSFKETGEKGAYLVTVESGRVASCEFFATQRYVWNDLTVDITGKDLSAVTQGMRQDIGPKSICRLTFVGQGPLDTMLRKDHDNVSKAISSSTGCIVSDIVVHTIPEIDIEARSKANDMGSAIIMSGRHLSEKSKEEILKILFENKQMLPFRDEIMRMSEEDVRALVDDAVKCTLARMEAMR
ncbi:DNA double-strand break repair protein Mre11 [methanogenic archaeon mixed culture ISO4-G1]|nr:DNA double-strand break repair protein Mre11 [methanogenic archaeon mixed culture ISO4-G1]